MLSRISLVARRVPATARFYSPGREAGSVTASSKAFQEKERSHENLYISQHEAAQLKKLKAEIDAKQKELDKLEAEHDAIVGEKDELTKKP